MVRRMNKKKSFIILIIITYLFVIGSFEIELDAAKNKLGKKFIKFVIESFSHNPVSKIDAKPGKFPLWNDSMKTSIKKFDEIIKFVEDISSSACSFIPIVTIDQNSTTIEFRHINIDKTDKKEVKFRMSDPKFRLYVGVADLSHLELSDSLRTLSDKERLVFFELISQENPIFKSSHIRVVKTKTNLLYFLNPSVIKESDSEYSKDLIKAFGNVHIRKPRSIHNSIQDFLKELISEYINLRAANNKPKPLIIYKKIKSVVDITIDKIL